MVEARGIEPLSKNKIRTASTRLAKVKISSKKAHFPKPKFVKRYLDGATLVRKGVQSYANEVKNKIFPSEEFSYQG